MPRHSGPGREHNEVASQETMGRLLKKDKLKSMSNAARCCLDAADRQPKHRAPTPSGQKQGGRDAQQPPDTADLLPMSAEKPTKSMANN